MLSRTQHIKGGFGIAITATITPGSKQLPAPAHAAAVDRSLSDRPDERL